MRKKITIAGVGRVGSTVAQLCAAKELGDLVLWNRTEGVAKGLALDISEAGPIEGFDVDILGTGDFNATKDSDVVCITAGAQRKPGMSRGELLNINASIVKHIARELAARSPNAVLLVTTNPLDAMVYAAAKASGFPKRRVLGMAGILDSSRFRSFIATELGVSVEDVSALVLGGHGDFMVPLPAHASVNGIPLSQLLPARKIAELVAHTRRAGGEIVELTKETSAFYAPAAALVEMIEAVVKDKKRVLPCAAYLHGEYGIRGIFMGVPVKIGAGGAEKILELKLNRAEKKEFQKSAAKVRALVAQLRL